MRVVGIRTQLALLVLVAIVPCIALVVYSYVSAQRLAVQQARDRLVAVGELARATQEQSIEGVRQLLATVASGPSVRRVDLLPQCREFLHNLGEATPGLGNVGLMDLAGDVQCQADPEPRSFNAADRLYFRNAVRDLRFSVGEFFIGRTSGRKRLGFGLPVFDDDGRLRGVAFASIDLIHANQRFQALALPGNLRVEVTDARGTLLVSNRGDEAAIGQPVANLALLDAIRAGRVDGLDTTDTRGAPQLHQLLLMNEAGRDVLYVVVTAPVDEIVAPAQRHLRDQLVVLLLAAIAGLWLARRLSERQIARPVSGLLARMQAAALGAPLAEHPPPSRIKEFAQLQTGLTDMLQQLQQQQEQLLRAQQITRVGFYRLDLRTGLYDASSTVYDMLGLDPARGPISLAVHQALIHPADAQRLHAEQMRLRDEGMPLRLQYRVLRHDGQVRWLDGFGFVERDSAGTIVGEAGALQDITEQQRLRRLYAVQSQINEAIIRTASPRELYERACAIAIDEGQLRMAWVGTLDASRERLEPLVHAGHEAGYLDLVRRGPVDLAQGTQPIPTALRSGEVNISNDFAHDDRLAAWRDEAINRGYAAVAAVPIKVDGRPVAVWALLASEPHYFQDAEVRLIEAIGESLSLAITNFRNDAARRATESQLRLLETCVSRLNDIVLITEAEPLSSPGPRILFVNDAFERRTGYTRAEVIGQSPRLLQGPGTDRRALDRIRAALTARQPVREELVNYTKDGRAFWLEVDIVPVADATGWYTHWVAIERDITERKLAEHKEADLSESFRLMFLGNPHPMWVYDLHTRMFLEVNNAAIRQYGYSRAAFLSMRIEELFPPQERERLDQRLRERLQGRPTVAPEAASLWTQRRSNAELLVVELMSQRLVYREHSAELVVAMDLTERQRAETAREQAIASLQDSEARLARAQSLAQIGSWERLAVDRSGVWSAGFHEITAHDPALGTPSLEAYAARIHPQDAPGFLAAFNEALTEGSARRFSYRYLHPDGRVRWFEESINQPLRREDGSVMLIDGTVQDITQRRESEQRLRAQHSRTELLNQITRAIADRIDLKSIYQVVCDSIEQRFGVDIAAAGSFDAASGDVVITALGAATQRRAESLGLAVGARLTAAGDGLARCLAGTVVHEPTLAGVDFALPRRLARAGLGSAVFAPLQSEARVFGVLITARAVGHGFSSGECEFLLQLSEHVALAANQAQLHESLQQAYDELRETQHVMLQQERLRVLGQMASGIAHDINNAISPAALYTESLLDHESGLSERGRSQLQTVQLAIDDVAETVARMREFYRPGDARVGFKPVDLNLLVQQVVDLTRARWRDIPQRAGIGIALQLALQPGLDPVDAHEGEVRDALTNLVLNAVDAMPHGGQLRIATRHVPSVGSPHRIEVAVGDSGVGMSEETRRRCFEPFYTTKGEQGSGLGLAMVYGTMKRHRGEVEIDSALGDGTVVRLSFPLSRRESDHPADAPSTPVPDPSLHVLVVDDDVLLLGALRDALIEQGHRVDAAPGGQEGIDAFLMALRRHDPYDAVVTDLGMPHVDGRAVALAVKSTAADTTVIMLTGWGRRMEEAGEIPTDIDHLLSKPPRLGELRQALVSSHRQKDPAVG